MKKPLTHDVSVFCSRFAHSQSNMCSEHRRASWVSSWTTGSNSSGSNVPLPSSKWKHPRFRKIKFLQLHFVILCPKNDLILSDSNHQLQDLFTICRQCRTACIYTCQLPATVWFRLSAEFPYPTGWKSSNTSAQRCRWRARLQGPAAGAISPRSTHGDIPYRVVRGGTSPKFHCGLLCAARLMETQPRGETPSLWKEWQNFPNHFRALTLAQGPQVSKQVLYVVISCANLHKSIMWLKGEVRGQWAFVRYLKSKNIADNTKTAGSSMKLDHWYKPKNQKRSSTPHFVTLGL